MARLISNSGGRTSGLMTRMVIDAGLGPDDYIVFTNTGKEREETLKFLHDQETHWGVKIYWLEYCRINKWKEVTYETASRNGEPFWELLMNRRKGKLYLPNIMMRFCTQELKIRVMRDFMRSQGHSHWSNYVGIRYDEQRRLSTNKGNAKSRERWDNVYPLNSAKITKPDVLAFWQQQPFDLQLKEHEGNCDLCFLKGINKRKALIRDNPAIADWWIAVEEAAGGSFRKAEPVQLIRDIAMLDMFPAEPVNDPSFSCFCGD